MVKKSIMTFFTTLGLSLIALSGCGGGEKVVPTYKGMTISGNSYTRKLVSELNDSSSPDGSTTTEEQPSLSDDIEDIVTIDVVDDGEVKYFVNPGEKFIIEVHIDNPNDYEIQSFTLNGEKYANYMFKDGSTMELLLLETTAPSTSGYIEYTIDAIKYIDGTDIKDVNMSTANKTIGAGVKYANGPTAKAENEVIGTNTLSMNITVADSNSLIGENPLKVYLTNGEEVIESKDLKIGKNEIKFENLYLNKSYEYGVAATFDQVDGKGLHSEWLLTKAIRTKGLFAFENLKVDDSSIKADITKTDETISGEISLVELYKGEQLVKTNIDKKVLFEGLDSFTDYKLVFKYSYVRGEQSINETIIKELKTSPLIEFTNCRIINTSAVSEGDTIYMQANIVNPYNTTPKSAVVNGQTYNCTGSTSSTKIYLEIVNNGQFKGGLTELIVEKVNMTIDGKDYAVEAHENNKDSIFINGIIEVTSATFVNEENEEIDHYFQGDTMYLLVKVNNETNYIIDSFSFGGEKTKVELTTTDFEKIDNSTYRIPLDGSEQRERIKNQPYFSAINYHNEYISSVTKPGFEIRKKPMELSGIVEISTVDDLLNTPYYNTIEGFKYYKLMNDIDLKDTPWTKDLGSLGGIFDGNGYKIKNITNVSTFTDEVPNLSLFGYLMGGVIKNLTLEDITLIVTINSSSDRDMHVYYGGIVGRSSGGGIIKNCSVSGDIVMTNNCNYGGLYVGGIAAYGEYFYDCKVNMSISLSVINNRMAVAGGLVANYSDNIVANNCEINANITVKQNGERYGKGGGVIGMILMKTDATPYEITNCSVKGTIDAKEADVIGYGFSPADYGKNRINVQKNTCDITINGTKVTEIKDVVKNIN